MGKDGWQRLGTGAILERLGQPKQRGRFSVDGAGLWFEPGLLRFGDPQMIAAWSDVRGLEVSGSEAQTARSTGKHREAFHVFSTKTRSTTTARASTTIEVTLPVDLLVVTLTASPARVRSLLGPVLARF